MRTHVDPAPRSRCDLCNGELRLKQVIEPANGVLDLDEQIFVCVKCGREQAYIASHNHYSPHRKAP